MGQPTDDASAQGASSSPGSESNYNGRHQVPDVQDKTLVQEARALIASQRAQ